MSEHRHFRINIGTASTRPLADRTALRRTFRRSLFITLLAVLGILPVLVRAHQTTQNDANWPHEVMSNGDKVVIFQPEIDHWKNGKLTASAAITITRAQAPQPQYGVVSLTADAALEPGARSVKITDIEITKGRFPGAGAGEDSLIALVKRSVMDWQPAMPTDALLANITVTQEENRPATPLKSDPPTIYVRTAPTTLVLIDGDPKLRQVPQSDLLRVVNTPADILVDTRTATYYLRGDGRWMAARSLAGPWSVVTDPAGLPVDASETDAPPILSPISSPPPQVIVSTTPAELIQINGDPQLAPIRGTDLFYVTNTDSDLFLQTVERRYYVTLSGRWYRATELDGPWTFVAASKLPVDFAKIPPGHPRAEALASVPSSQEAKDAVAAAETPQTTGVRRDAIQATAQYDGPPQFQPVPGANLSYAVNSPNDVILAGQQYYMVSQGLWFVAPTAFGPWLLSDYVPPAIYAIPPSSPLYPDTFVYVLGSTPDYVFYGYTPGYLGAYIYGGVVVYGTGYWYPGWVGTTYFGYPWTWGGGHRLTHRNGDYAFLPAQRNWYYRTQGNRRVFYNLTGNQRVATHSFVAPTLYQTGAFSGRGPAIAPGRAPVGNGAPGIGPNGGAGNGKLPAGSGSGAGQGGGPAPPH